jgi:hypothetical protein
LIRTRNWVLVFCVCVTESGISSTKKGGYRLQNIRHPRVHEIVTEVVQLEKVAVSLSLFSFFV